MNTFLKGGAVALPMLLLATPAGAQDTGDNPDDAPIVVSAVTLHPAAGLMNEHTHDGGELMLALRYTRNQSGGANQHGTRTVTDAAIHAAGFTARTADMRMDMAMLDIMYAPSDSITLMVMPQWMRHEMTMVGIDPDATGEDNEAEGEHSHASLGFGERATHATQGIGDTLVSASYRLVNSRAVKAHVTLGLWVPTGKVERKNPDGTFVHYGMQSGSGTWDIAPSLTVSGEQGAFGWGAQASYRWRSESANASGFAYGDEAAASLWASWLASNSFSLTARTAWEHEGIITGHYNSGHNHASPADRQANYGGDVMLAAVGANLALPSVGARRPQIGVEVGVPFYQRLNGFQPPENWRLAVSLSQQF